MRIRHTVTLKCYHFEVATETQRLMLVDHMRQNLAREWGLAVLASLPKPPEFLNAIQPTDELFMEMSMCVMTQVELNHMLHEQRAIGYGEGHREGKEAMRKQVRARSQTMTENLLADKVIG